MKIKRVLVILIVPVLFACATESPEPTGKPLELALENGSFKTELNGFGIHYEVQGEGPVLMVLSNSWGINVPALRALLGDLENDLTMVYFDPRGRIGFYPGRVRYGTRSCPSRFRCLAQSPWPGKS